MLHLGAGDGYGLFFILITLVGLYLLFQTLVWIKAAPAAKRSVFLFFWAASLLALTSTGVNYSLFRFVLPAFCTLLVYRRLTSPQTDRQHALNLLLPVPLYLLLLADSPELAIAFALGILVYVLRFGRLSTPLSRGAYAVTTIALLAITLAAGRLGLLATMHAFRTGGYNFPIMPAPHLLLLLLAIGLTACYSGNLLRSRTPSALLALLPLGSIALAAALGRCDPTHVLFNGLPWLVTASLLTYRRKPLLGLFQPALWLVFVILPGLVALKPLAVNFGKAALPTILATEHPSTPTHLDTLILRRMTAQLGPALAQEKFAEYHAASAARGSDFNLDGLFHQPAGTVYEAPFGFSITHFGLYHAADVDEGYFFENLNLVTPDEVHRKVGELAAHSGRPLLLLDGRENACKTTAVQSRARSPDCFFIPIAPETSTRTTSAGHSVNSSRSTTIWRSLPPRSTSATPYGSQTRRSHPARSSGPGTRLASRLTPALNSDFLSPRQSPPCSCIPP